MIVVKLEDLTWRIYMWKTSRLDEFLKRNESISYSAKMDVLHEKCLSSSTKKQRDLVSFNVVARAVGRVEDYRMGLLSFYVGLDYPWKSFPALRRLWRQKLCWLPFSFFNSINYQLTKGRSCGKLSKFRYFCQHMDTRRRCSTRILFY